MLLITDLLNQDPISALSEASFELNPTTSLLFTWNDIPQPPGKGIISFPVWKWLLSGT